MEGTVLRRAGCVLRMKAKGNHEDSKAQRK